MKIRFGFVSNSSSSSFVITTTKENFDKVLAESDDYTKEVIEELGIGKTTFLGKELVYLSTFSDHSGNSNFDEISNEELDSGDEGRCASDVFDKFCDKLRGNKDEVFEANVDF